MTSPTEPTDLVPGPLHSLPEHALLKIATENARVGLVIIGPDRRYLYANTTYAEILRLPSSDIVGQRMQDVLARIYEEQVRPRLDEAFRGQRVSYELRRAASDGDRYYAVCYEPASTNGSVALVVVVVTDITERRLLSDEQQRSERALREERDRAQRYLDTAEVILLALDTKRRITLINRKGCEILGWTEEELLGRDWVETCLPERLRAGLRLLFHRLVEGDLPVLENPIVTKSGQERLIEWRNRLLRDDSGRVIGTFSSGADITERRRLEQQYHQAQRMEAVGRLAGGIAHDFNNLLTAILGYSQLLLDDFGADDPRRADVMEIRKAGESAAGLTRQLLAFSRKQIIAPTLLDLNAVIRNLQGMLTRLIGDDVRIVLNLQPDVAMVNADSGQMEQIVLNLAVNARDAMPDGGTLTIATVSVDLDEHYASRNFSVMPGPYVAMTVTDTGTGMTSEICARLFEPFFTTKDPGKGTGLGLATVHGIVLRGGGSIGVRSEVGNGSAFTVYLPRADGSEAVDAEPLPAGASRASGQTVLVVDDSDGLRDLARRMLELQGYAVLLARSASEAFELFGQNEAIDVVLTDVVMPGGSGPELIRRLTVLRPGLKTVYMSGYTEDAITHHGVLDPGTAFLHKPFTMETLGRTMREVLHRA